jgi:TonB family protein
MKLRSDATRWCAAVCCALLAGGCGRSDAADVAAPVPLEEPAIDYPIALWDRGVEGETVIMIHVDAHGQVDSVLVSKTSGYSEFDSAAVAGARRLRFSPGRRGEKRIAMWTRIPVRFAQDSSAAFGDAVESGVRHN